MKNKWKSIVCDERVVFGFGLLLTLLITSLEFLHHGAENYIIFRDATLNFWAGVSSYTPEFVAAHGRFYVYTPVFNVLFAPFAYLPLYVGGYLWNLLGYCLFWYAIRGISVLRGQLVPMAWYLLLMVMQSVFPFQFNLLVCDIFLLAYVLLERDKGFWAVALMMVSATCKVYGAVELALLLCYPRFWRNLGYSVLWAAGLLLLPAVKLGGDTLAWYMDWMGQLSVHTESTWDYVSLIFAWPLKFFALTYMRWFQGAVLAGLGVVFFACYRSWQTESFRIGVLATLMMYIVIMSESAEFTTHTISMTGYALWLFYRIKTAGGYRQLWWGDKVLMWTLFAFFAVMPIDIFFPSPWCMYLHTTLWIGVWVMALAWFRVICTTVLPARLPSFIRFCIVGTIAAAIHYGIYFVLQWLDINLSVAYTAGYLLSFVVNYYLTNYFTFGTRPEWKNFLGFAGSHGVNYLLHIVLFNVFISLGVHRLIAPPLVMLVAMLVQYTILNWVFKKWKGNH